MIRWTTFFVGLLLFSVSVPWCTQEAFAWKRTTAGFKEIDTLVLCPLDFQLALTDWLRHRSEQGHRIRVVSPAPIADGIRRQIQEAAALNPLKTVVLVGDSGDQFACYQQLVATDYVPAQVNVFFGSDQQIATDGTYADLDFDGLPELTIGRIPVDSATQLKQFVARVISYESNQNENLESSLWRRRINLVAGVGGLGRVVDSVIEQTTKQMITELVPAEYQTTMTYGSWSSPFCPDPRRFSETTINRFNEGCLFWVYVGHGNRRSFDYVRLPDQVHPILDTNRARRLACDRGSPIAICLACYSGATDARCDGLAETMLMQPKGPIAVLAGTRVTMPYAMSLLSLEMMEEYFRGEAETLGELVRKSTWRMASEQPAKDRYRRLIHDMGENLSPYPQLLSLERLEHAKLIHLLGDPLLRLPRPQSMTIAAAREIVAGSTLRVTGEVPCDGAMQLELVYERDRFLNRPKRRREYEASDSEFRGYQETYDQVQHRTVSKITMPVKAGSFEQVVNVPANISGRCQVRVVVASPKVFAAGSAPVRVKKSDVSYTARKR